MNIIEENGGEIKPAQLWAFLKDNDDVQLVGRVCVALGGHDIELNSGEKACLNLILRDSIWRKRRIDEKRENWNNQKRRQREKASAGEGNQGAAPADVRKDGAPAEVKKPTAAPAPVEASRPAPVENLSPAFVPFCPTVDDIKKLCQQPTMSIKPSHVDSFSSYVIGEHKLPDHKPSNIYSYLKSIYRTWVSEGWCDPDRHRITKEELLGVVREMNKKRATKIPEDAVSGFWNYLVAADFERKNGDEITKYNVRHTLNEWYEIHAKDAESVAGASAAEQEHQRELDDLDRKMREDD